MTTLFAPVIPFGVENTLRSMSIVPSAIVLTPSAVLRFGDRYVKMYAAGPKPSTIFINGGLGDTDKPQPFPLAIDAAMKVSANYIILPDAEHDSAATIKVAKRAIHTLKQRKGFPSKVIGVPQGTDYADYVDCANSLVDMGVDALGASRNIYEVDRFRANYISAFRSFGVPVHILGFTNDLHDDLYCAKFPGVESIASAMPIWYGQKHKVLPNPWPSDTSGFGKRPADFFGTEEVTTEMLANLFIVSSWLGGLMPCAS